jgi:hypothetical protein
MLLAKRMNASIALSIKVHVTIAQGSNFNMTKRGQL